MVARPVLDTDILIDFLRGAGPGRDLIKELGPHGYAVTAVTAFELALARSYREEPRPVHAVLSAPLLTLTRKAALRAGELLAELRRRGEPIDVRDALQAGICVAADTTLVTRNVAHFERIAELHLAHPTEAVRGRPA